jgi:tetratricopeptide (TPR) repeat protein
MQPDHPSATRSPSSRSCSRRLRTIRTVVLTVAVTVVALAVPAVGSAQPANRRDAKARAEAKLAEAAAAVERGAFDKALAPLREAEALYPSPKLHFNFATVFRGLGQDLQALESFERYLEEVDRPEMATYARAAVVDLRRRVATVVVACDTPQATILIDGAPRAVIPSAGPPGAAGGPVALLRSLYVLPGAHEVLIRRDGLAARHQERIEVAAGETRRIQANLAPSAQAPTAAPPPMPVPSLGPVRTSPGSAGSGPPTPDAEASTERPHAASALVRSIELGSAIASAGALGFAIVKHVQAADRARTFHDHRAPDGGPDLICGEDETGRGGPGCSDLYDRARGALTWAYIGYGVAGALAIGSALLYLSTRPGEGTASPLAVGCAPLLADRGLTCALRF